MSNGLDLGRLNWGNYDLIVIDESHNFRNGIGTHSNTQENRYQKLMEKVIRAGVKTKVLMLSATPVNNRFVDLKNQLAIAYEGNAENLDERLNTTKSLEDIFKQAQKAFNAWSRNSVPRTRCFGHWILISSSCWTVSPLPGLVSISKSITTRRKSENFRND